MRRSYILIHCVPRLLSFFVDDLASAAGCISHHSCTSPSPFARILLFAQYAPLVSPTSPIANLTGIFAPSSGFFGGLPINLPISVETQPGQQALIRTFGFSRARMKVKALTHALEKEYERPGSPNPPADSFPAETAARYSCAKSSSSCNVKLEDADRNRAWISGLYAFKDEAMEDRFTILLLASGLDLAFISGRNVWHISIVPW
jgi:hypothetical protein